VPLLSAAAGLSIGLGVTPDQLVGVAHAPGHVVLISLNVSNPADIACPLGRRLAGSERTFLDGAGDADVNQRLRPRQIGFRDATVARRRREGTVTLR
jgi:hypothetical protein